MEARQLGGSGACPPKKFVDFWCSEIDSAAIWAVYSRNSFVVRNQHIQPTLYTKNNEKPHYHLNAKFWSLLLSFTHSDKIIYTSGKTEAVSASWTLNFAARLIAINCDVEVVRYFWKRIL